MAVRSLLTGATGLRGHQTMLDVVANNLSNVNTTAYKSKRLRFADQMYDSIRSASGPSGTLGGTNPQQIGLGARVSAIDKDFQQGVLELTGNELDVAIQDNGFFIVTDGTQTLYTRAGAFDIDEDGFLVDTGTGFHVQRVGTAGEGGPGQPVIQAVGNSNIRIPYGTLIPGERTAQITLTGNLDAQAIGPRAEVLTGTVQLTDALGNPATVATPLTDLFGGNLAAGDTITFSGSQVNGTAVPPTAFNVGANNVGALINAISAAYASGDPINGATAGIQNGYIVLTANSSRPASLVLSLTDTRPQPNNWGAFSVTTDGKDGDRASSAIEIFDSQGSPHVLTLTWEKRGTNIWRLTADTQDGTFPINPVTGVANNVVDEIHFNADGSLGNIFDLDPGITIDWTGSGVGTGHTIEFDHGTAQGYNGITQFGGFTSATASDQDGFGAGNLISVDVEKDGTITGLFSNSQRSPIAQLAMAIFANQAGLNEEGTNYFGVSPNSGIPLIGTPGTGGRGTVVNGVLEASNVDVGVEFVRLITAQRGFQVNARTIRVSDEVLEEAVNIIR